MKRTMTLRQKALLDDIIPGVAWGIIGVCDMIPDGNAFVDLILRCMSWLSSILIILVLVRLISKGIETDDEMTRQAWSSACQLSYTVTLTALFLLIAVDWAFKLTVMAACSFGICLLMVSRGVSFLHLMGQEDAYPED